VTSIAFDGGAAVSWGSPPGGGPPASYVVTPYIAGVAQAATAVTAPASSAAVTGLTNGTAYTFQVQAVSQAGTALSPMSGANTPLANLIFGDDFNGTVLDPHWLALTRDGDQSNAEAQYYLPSNVTLDGASHLVITTRAVPVQAYAYNDANPPTYQGTPVTRQFQAGAVQWAWPGSLAASQGLPVTTSPGYNFFYGKVQVSALVPDLTGTGNGWPGIWMLGANCEQTNPLDPSNVGSCNWPNAGSEEIVIAEFRLGVITSYNAVLLYATGNSGTQAIPVSTAATTYHTYEVDWSAGSVQWALDGTLQGTPWTTSVPSTPQFLIIESAMRGSCPVNQPLLSADWVRVFHN
jgi:hypothetical protein